MDELKMLVTNISNALVGVVSDMYSRSTPTPTSTVKPQNRLLYMSMLGIGLLAVWSLVFQAK